jgi:hypothetical protein
MKQLKISLSSDLRERLGRASAAAGCSLGEMVRQKLEQAFAADDAGDLPTRQLMVDLAALIAEIRALAGSSWDVHPDVHAAVVEAIKVWLEAIAPPRTGNAAQDLLGFWSGVDPLTVGQMIAMQRLSRRPHPMHMNIDAIVKSLKKKEGKDQ